MPNPVTALVDKHLGADFLPRMKQLAVGLAEDFWHDGNENPFAFIKHGGRAAAALAIIGKVPGGSKTSAATSAESKKAPAKPVWHAQAGEISEKMWGAGLVIPGGNTIWDALTSPLGMNKTMSLLDLSAGLGGFVRKTTEAYGVYVTGLEPDKEVAARGMELSVRAGKAKTAPVLHYEAATFASEHMYDCVLARETFYRLADKPVFFKKLADKTKPKAQLAFTDYIVDPENRDKPAVKAWLAKEKGASPFGLVEMAEAWAKVGFSLRVNEDLSAYYIKEVTAGLRRLAVSLASGLPPDAETKKALRRRIETWTHRIAAMEQGMKFYRFYGTKQ